MRAVSKEFATAACVLAAIVFGGLQGVAAGEDTLMGLPEGVEAVWGLEEAYRESTKTRQRICINGLWRWQPADPNRDEVPGGDWGHFKVPGCWPGITDYMQKDCQTVFAHPSWKEEDLRGTTAAWYQREITVPRQEEAATVSGVILDPKGRPAANREVHLRVWSSGSWRPSSLEFFQGSGKLRRVVTDKQGRFTLDPMPRWRWLIVPGVRHHAESHGVVVSLGAGSVSGVKIKLPPDRPGE